jgi:hypothetical protein
MLEREIPVVNPPADPKSQIELEAVEVRSEGA